MSQLVSLVIGLVGRALDYLLDGLISLFAALQRW
jgi:hypothetical protein